MTRGTRGSAFNRKGFDPTGMYDYKPGNFNYSGFDVKDSLVGNRYDDFGGYSDIFTTKKKETDNFLKDFLNRKKPDEDSTSAKVAEGIYKSFRPDKKSSEDKINDMIAARIGLGNQGGGFGGVQDVAQGLTLSGQGGGLREPMIIAGQEGKPSPIAGGIAGAAGGYLQGGPIGAVIGGIGGLFCDVRVKEDIAPLQKSEVNDLLSECAFFVKDLNECS